MDRGYVCLWRKLKDSDIIRHADLLQVFIALLVETNDRPTKRVMRYLDVDEILPGEVLIDYDKFRANLLLKRDQLIYMLNILQSMDIVEHIPLACEGCDDDCADEAVIVIRNWSTYQPPVTDEDYLEELINSEVDNATEQGDGNGYAH